MLEYETNDHYCRFPYKIQVNDAIIRLSFPSVRTHVKGLEEFAHHRNNNSKNQAEPSHDAGSWVTGFGTHRVC